MPIRMIAMDIDGTLLDSRWQLPPENRAAIVEAFAQGMEIVLVTGRRFDFAMPIARQLPCDLHLILNNGALVKSTDGTAHVRHLLPRGTARRVLESMRAFRNDATVVFDRPRERQIIFEQMDWSSPPRSTYFERNREFLAQVSPLEDCLDEDPIQVMFSGPFSKMRQAASALRDLPFAGDFQLCITEYEERDLSLLDVICQGCSKGATLEEWARRRGVRPEEVMAVGDNWNDREMLAFAGVSVVMGNSVPGLKSPGWRVTDTNDNAGLAQAIRNYALGER